MLKEELQSLPGGENPVLCRDGMYGLLTVWPSEDGLCGVQVHGEPDHRWIPCDELAASAGGALRQAGSPRPTPGADLSQRIVAASWLRQGGMEIPVQEWPPKRAVKVVRAEPGKPWPDPPHGGTWTRDPATGDLTLWKP